MKKVTIYDYARMCKEYGSSCADCPLSHANNESSLYCSELLQYCPDKANEIILDWCKEHPVETRRSKFLKMFPNADISCGFLDIGPCAVDKRLANEENCPTKSCLQCKNDYWLAEVER